MLNEELWDGTGHVVDPERMGAGLQSTLLQSRVETYMYCAYEISEKTYIFTWKKLYLLP